MGWILFEKKHMGHADGTKAALRSAQLLMETAMKVDQAPGKNATELVVVDAAFHKAADAGRDALRLYEAAADAVQLRLKGDPAFAADAAPAPAPASAPASASAQQELHGETEQKLESARTTLQRFLDRDPAQASKDRRFLDSVTMLLDASAPNRVHDILVAHNVIKNSSTAPGAPGTAAPTEAATAATAALVSSEPEADVVSLHAELKELQAEEATISGGAAAAPAAAGEVERLQRELAAVQAAPADSLNVTALASSPSISTEAEASEAKHAFQSRWSRMPSATASDAALSVSLRSRERKAERAATPAQHASELLVGNLPLSHPDPTTDAAITAARRALAEAESTRYNLEMTPSAVDAAYAKASAAGEAAVALFEAPAKLSAARHIEAAKLAAARTKEAAISEIMELKQQGLTEREASSKMVAETELAALSHKQAALSAKEAALRGAAEVKMVALKEAEQLKTAAQAEATSLKGLAEEARREASHERASAAVAHGMKLAVTKEAAKLKDAAIEEAEEETHQALVASTRERVSAVRLAAQEKATAKAKAEATELAGHATAAKLLASTAKAVASETAAARAASTQERVNAVRAASRVRAEASELSTRERVDAVRAASRIKAEAAELQSQAAAARREADEMRELVLKEAEAKEVALREMKAQVSKEVADAKRQTEVERLAVSSEKHATLLERRELSSQREAAEKENEAALKGRAAAQEKSEVLGRKAEEMRMALVRKALDLSEFETRAKAEKDALETKAAEYERRASRMEARALELKAEYDQKAEAVLLSEKAATRAAAKATKGKDVAEQKAAELNAEAHAAREAAQLAEVEKKSALALASAEHKRALSSDAMRSKAELEAQQKVQALKVQAEELAAKEEATKTFAKELQSEHARRLAEASSKLEARDAALTGKEAELEQMVSLAKEALSEVQQKRAETEERGRQALAEADARHAERAAAHAEAEAKLHTLLDAEHQDSVRLNVTLQEKQARLVAERSRREAAQEHAQVLEGSNSKFKSAMTTIAIQSEEERAEMATRLEDMNKTLGESKRLAEYELEGKSLALSADKERALAETRRIAIAALGTKINDERKRADKALRQIQHAHRMKLTDLERKLNQELVWSATRIHELKQNLTTTKAAAEAEIARKLTIERYRASLNLEQLRDEKEQELRSTHARLVRERRASDAKLSEANSTTKLLALQLKMQLEEQRKSHQNELKMHLKEHSTRLVSTETQLEASRRAAAEEVASAVDKLEAAQQNHEADLAQHKSELAKTHKEHAQELDLVEQSLRADLKARESELTEKHEELLLSHEALDDAELKVQEAHAKVVTGEYALKNMSAMAQRLLDERTDSMKMVIQAKDKVLSKKDLKLRERDDTLAKMDERLNQMQMQLQANITLLAQYKEQQKSAEHARGVAQEHIAAIELRHNQSEANRTSLEMELMMKAARLEAAHAANNETLTRAKQALEDTVYKHMTELDLQKAKHKQAQEEVLQRSKEDLKETETKMLRMHEQAQEQAVSAAKKELSSAHEASLKESLDKLRAEHRQEKAEAEAKALAAQERLKVLVPTMEKVATELIHNKTEKMRAAIIEMKANVEVKAQELEAQRAQLHERDRAVWHLNSTLQEKEELIHRKELHLQEKEAELKQERKDREKEGKDKHRRLQELESIAAESKNKIAHQVRQRVEAERDAGFLLRNISRLEEHMSRKRHEEHALAANLSAQASQLTMASEVAAAEHEKVGRLSHQVLLREDHIAALQQQLEDAAAAAAAATASLPGDVGTLTKERAAAVEKAAVLDTKAKQLEAALRTAQSEAARASQKGDAALRLKETQLADAKDALGVAETNRLALSNEAATLRKEIHQHNSAHGREAGDKVDNGSLNVTKGGLLEERARILEERAALDKRTEDSAAASRRLESKEADLAALQAEMDAVQAKYKLDLLEAQQGKDQREQLLATLQADQAAMKADSDEKAKAQEDKMALLRKQSNDAIAYAMDKNERAIRAEVQAVQRSIEMTEKARADGVIAKMNATAAAAMARAEALLANASTQNPEWVKARNESASDAIGDLAVQAERWQLMHNETLHELEGQKEMVDKLMLEKVGLLNQTAAELAAKDAELLRQRLKQRSAEEALSKIDRSLAEERAEMEQAESAVLEAESQHNELAKELETKKAELQDQVGQARKELAEAKRRQMAAALYSGPGVTHPEHKEALQLQAGAASAKLLQMEKALAEAKAALAQQQGTMHDNVGKARMAEQAKAAEAAKLIEEENGKADKAAHEAVAHLYEMEDALHRAREARATLEDTHTAALLASEQQARPAANTLSPVEAQQSADVQQALAESAASLKEAKLKVSKAEAERDAAKKGSDAREAKLRMVREKKRSHLKKLTGLYNALSDKYEMAVHASTPKANLDVFDKTAARAVKAEQERDAAAEQVASLKAQLRDAELASAQRGVSSEPTSANKLRLKVAEQTARADKSQEARVTLTRELASRDKTAAALVAEKSTLAAELAKQKQALMAAAVHLKKLESTSSAASEMASLQKKLDFQTDAHARAQKDKQKLSNELEKQHLDLQHEVAQHSEAVKMAASLQAELAQQKAHLATEQDKLHADGAGQASESEALGARERELESEAKGYATAERQAAKLAEEVQKQQLELSSEKELSAKAQEVRLTPTPTPTLTQPQSYPYP